MNNKIALTTTLTFAMVAPFALKGADDAENPNRFSFGPRFGLNYKADFHNSPANFNAVNPGPPTGGANHTYNDGYVLVDGTGNAGGLTTDWGYQNASQVVGDAMQFHAIQSTGASSASDNAQYGGEVIYQRVLGVLPCAPAVGWGLEGAFGFTEINLRDSHTATSPVITDTYPLNGVLPPGPGFNGTFNGPGALLGDTPVRTITSANIASRNSLSGQMYGFRLGPFVEWHLTHKLSLTGSVGLTLAPTKIDYDFSENATLADGSKFAAVGHSSKTELLYGPYVGATVRYDFTRNWGGYVGAQFQNLTDLTQSVGGRTARFDPGATVNLTAGVTWSF